MGEENTGTRKERLHQFFEEYGYHQEVLKAVDAFPDTRSLYIDYNDLAIFDFELMEYFLQHPAKALYMGEQVMKEFYPPDKPNVKLHLRLSNVPKNTQVLIRNLRSRHLSRFISVEGLVRKAAEVRPKLVNGAFECKRCGGITMQEQEDRFFQEPLECSNCNKPGPQTKFYFKPEMSDFIDSQFIEIQEKPEGLRGGEQPQTLPGVVLDDIAGHISPGDRVVLNGIMTGHTKGRSTTKLTVFDIVLDVNSVSVEEKEFEAIDISEEDEAEILELAKDKNVINKIRSSIAPTIWGMETEKEALALQLFSGVPKSMPDGTKIRGDIHVLLVGDPGTAKSQLLRYVSDMAPRGIYASGKSTSAAGLTAAAVRDELGDGRWTLEAGALVLADQGIGCIDELDKMTTQDRSSMHEAMEQQTVTVAKAGINATLHSRCAILGAANPKFGRFDWGYNLAEQIDMPPALLSRFDIIFPLTDKPDNARDLRVSEHVLKVHHLGEVLTQIEKGDVERADDMEEGMEAVKPPITPEMMRKYVAYARSHIFPVMTDDASTMLRDYYINIRGSAKEDGKVSITVRQLEAFIRLAEASARARMSKRVELSDAKRAINIVQAFLRAATGQGAGGGIDIDIIATGVSYSQREQLIALRELLRELVDQMGDVPLEDILEEGEDRGIPREKIKDYLEKLVQKGEIYKPKQGHYKIA